MNSPNYFFLAIIVVIALTFIGATAFNLLYSRRQPMMADSSKLIVLLTVPGMCALTIGFGLLAFDSEKYEVLGFKLFGAGMFVLLCSVALNSVMAKAKRAVWPVVSARCIKQTLENRINHEERDVWFWELLCEMEYKGKTYQVIPHVRWSDASRGPNPFGTEAKARKYIRKIVSQNGQCRIRLNPQDPLESEILPRTDYSVF